MEWIALILLTPFLVGVLVGTVAMIMIWLEERSIRKFKQSIMKMEIEFEREKWLAKNNE